MLQHLKDKTDAQIHHDVLQELHLDAHVDETEVGIQIGHGVVTLTGSVGSNARKMAAEEAAHRVVGVLDVADEIQVKDPAGSSWSDTQIAQAVRHALKRNAVALQESIETTVEAGCVILEGTSPCAADSQYAEHVVGSVAGVREIINNIHVSPAHGETQSEAQGDTEEIRRSMEAALGRRAERQFRRIRHEADGIQVQVGAGRVSLLGEVQTWSEKEAILGAAGHAPGIHAVEDHLLIKPAT